LNCAFFGVTEVLIHVYYFHRFIDYPTPFRDMEDINLITEMLTL